MRWIDNNHLPGGLPRAASAAEDINEPGLTTLMASEVGVSETDPLDLDTDDDALSDSSRCSWAAAVTVRPWRRLQAWLRWRAWAWSLPGPHIDSDTHRLYDGFYDPNAVGLDVGAGVVAQESRSGSFRGWASMAPTILIPRTVLRQLAWRCQ